MRKINACNTLKPKSQFKRESEYEYELPSWIHGNCHCPQLLRDNQHEDPVTAPAPAPTLAPVPTLAIISLIREQHLNLSLPAAASLRTRRTRHSSRRRRRRRRRQMRHAPDAVAVAVAVRGSIAFGCACLFVMCALSPAVKLCSKC